MQDAAKKALQQLLSGKKDILAAYDARDPPGGGGSGGGGGGGGGGGFGGFGDSFRDFGDNMWRFLKGLGSTLGAVLLFVGALVVMSLWQPIIAFCVATIRFVLRLDARSAGARRGRARPKVGLGCSHRCRP